MAKKSRGIVFCGCCGNRLELRKTKNPYYLCKRRSFISGTGCNELRMEKEVLEKTIWNVWEEHCRLFETMPASQFFVQKQAKLKKQETALRQELERLPAKKMNLYECFRSGELGKEAFLKEKEILNSREESVTRSVEEALRQIDELEVKGKRYRSVSELIEKYSGYGDRRDEFGEIE